MSPLLLATLLSIQGHTPASEVRQRVMVVEKEPSTLVERILASPNLDEAEVRRYGLVRIVTDRQELLVAEDLWSPSSIRLANLAMRRLAASSGKTPLTIGQLPSACQTAILNELNSRIHLGRGLAFNLASPVGVEMQTSVTASTDHSTQTFSTHQALDRAKTSSGTHRPGGLQPKADAEEVIPPVTVKSALIVRFPTALPDRAYWKNVSAAYKALDAQRRKLDEAFEKESNEIARSLFGESDTLSSIRVGDDLASLPLSLYDRQVAHMGAEEGRFFRNNARVSGVDRTLQIVFRVGSATFAFSPRALFEP